MHSMLCLFQYQGASVLHTALLQHLPILTSLVCATYNVPAALSFQCFFLGLLILAPAGPVGEDFAGLVPFPVEFRGKICLLLFVNLVISWLADSAASWAYGKVKGRQVCGLTVA
jgi:hypothetical protein